MSILSQSQRDPRAPRARDDPCTAGRRRLIAVVANRGKARAQAKAAHGKGAPRRNLTAELNRLERVIRTLHVDYQRFLAGDLKIPPQEAAARDTVRRLRSATHGVAEAYRLNSLEAKLSSTVGYFNRQLRRREMVAVRKKPNAGHAFDPAAGITLRSGAASEQGEEQLYKALAPPVDLERFRAHLRRNAEAIRAKTGCQNIRFRIAVVDGKKKLKAKPVRDAS